MAGENCCARFLRLVTDTSLRLRQPARRCAGSERHALLLSALVLGTYSLLVGSLTVWRAYWFMEIAGLVITCASISYINSILNIILIFVILMKDDTMLNYVLSASMAVYMVSTPLVACNFLATAIVGRSSFIYVPLMELPRFGLGLLHLALLYCVLAELRGDPLPPMPPFPPAPVDGWLKNNLAAASADPSLVKVRVDKGPAVFAPSSCTTVAPVHPSCPPPNPPPATPSPAASPINAAAPSTNAHA